MTDGQCSRCRRLYTVWSDGDFLQCCDRDAPIIVRPGTDCPAFMPTEVTE